MYDLTGKLIDCSELRDMTGGEQIFNLIKKMCKGVDGGDLGKFSIISKYHFLKLGSGYIYLTNIPYAGHSEIIKPVDIVGEHRMNAAKDGAVLLEEGWKPPVDPNKVLYWSNGYVQSPCTVFAAPFPEDVHIIAYKLLPKVSIPEGAERVFSDELYMRLSPTFEIMYFKKGEWITPEDQNFASRRWDGAIELNVPLPINAKILAEKTGTSAQDIIKAGLGHISDRAVTYDKPEGERSMGATVAAFNEVTGHNITEEQGWHFMTLLKIVHSQQGDFKVDNYEDGSA